MTRWTLVLVGGLALAALVGCAAQSAPGPAAGAAPSQKTIAFGFSMIEPDDLVISASDTIGFLNRGGDPMQVEFLRPKNQAGKITCRVTDPKQLKPGEAPWAEFRTNGEGHFTAAVPAGRFPSTCTLAPGSYAYVVRVMNAQMRPTEEKLGQLGTITVK